MSFFEALMLVCFGVGWPVSIAKSLRTGVVRGKSPLFMAIVCLGYLSGITHKVVVDYDWVIILYGFNLLMVAADLMLYFCYLPADRQTTEAVADSIEPASPPAV